MTTYKSIRGLTVQAVATDPEVYAGSWSSGNNLNTARSRAGGSTQATQTAGIVFGAADPPYGQTEEYNGTSWSNQENMNGGRYISYGGGGTQTATITAGGYYPAGSPQYQTVLSETYNGTSWTEVNELNTGRIDCTTFGTSTAALLVGGGSAAGGPGTVANVESWNGTSWSETTDIPATRQEMAGWGLATAGAIVGGSQDSNPTMTAETLEFNGSAWTAGGDYSSVVKYFAAFGTADNGIAAGGSNGPANLSVAANYNGTSWTEVAELASVRRGNMANGASGTSGVTAGGEIPPGAQTNVTEEWGFPPDTANILVEGMVYFNDPSIALKGFGKNAGLPSATWSSGATYPASIYAAAGFGTQDSAVVASYAPGGGTEAASYNGTSWTVITDVSTDSTEKTGFGESNSNGYLVKGSTENWNGSSWTEVADATNSFSLRTGFGAPGSAIVAAGESPPSGSNLVESWNGSAWTEVSELNTARYAAGGGGSGNTSGIIAGGTTGSNIDNSETWDGSSWTEGGNLNTARHRVGSAGKSVSSSLIFGGESITGKTESYNGTAWTELTDMTTARIDPAFGNIGVNVAALAVGGRTPPATNVTEEFTASAAVSTVTTSQT